MIVSIKLFYVAILADLITAFFKPAWDYCGSEVLGLCSGNAKSQSLNKSV